MPIEKVCLWCKKIYKRKPYEESLTKFCSRECRLAYQKKTAKEVPCSYCGKPVIVNWSRKETKRVYCGVSCYHNDIAAKSKVTCAGCGIEFLAYKSRQGYYSRLYCSKECYLKNGRLPSTPGYIANEKYEKVRQRLCCHAQYLKWKSEVLKRDGYKCTCCGDENFLKVHHKMELYRIVYKYNPKLSLDNLSGILHSTEFNDLSNGITLCSSCHIKAHRISPPDK